MNSSLPVHLQCRSHYSLRSSLLTIPQIINLSKQHQLPAIGLTDLNLSGVREFEQLCRADGIQPIIGSQIWLQSGSLQSMHPVRHASQFFKVVLYAMNQVGFQNLMQISSTAWMNVSSEFPVITKETLQKYNDGLICLTGNPQSELADLLQQGQSQSVAALLQLYQHIFPDRLFLEIVDPRIQDFQQLRTQIVSWAERFQLPLVPAYEVCYANCSDQETYQVYQRLKSSPDHSRSVHRSQLITQKDAFFRSPDEMAELYREYPDVFAGTQEIIERCEVALGYPSLHFPKISLSPEESKSQFLRRLCHQGLQFRYGETPPQEVQDRLEYELKIIEQRDACHFFLILWDLFQYSQRHDIPCLPRGSANASLVNYLLGVSEFCPIKNRLPFECYWDAGLIECPIMSLDVCREKSQQILQYIKKSYGEECLALVSRFVKWSARHAVIEIAGILEFPPQQLEEILSLLPHKLGLTVEEAIAESEQLQQCYENDSQINKLLSMSAQVQSLHLDVRFDDFGYVLTDQPIQNCIPLERIPGIPEPVTQWSDLQSTGLLRFYLVRLRYLTILGHALRFIRNHYPERLFDLKEIPLDDAPTFSLLQRGETYGVFQFESLGMQDFLKQLQPDRFSDLMAMIALYRPGPLDSGLTESFILAKQNRISSEELPTIVEQILEETYGILVFPEQAMQILHQVSGLNWQDSLYGIRLLKQQQHDEILQIRRRFEQGASCRQLSSDPINLIWEILKRNTPLAFFKSHTMSYSLLAYQLAYLKTHFPREFMMGLLICDHECPVRQESHSAECQRMNVEVRWDEVEMERRETARVYFRV